MPEYILLPEVSIPERWIDSIANRVVAANVSLAAGVEYMHRADGRIFSEACLILTDDRLGYPASVEIRQLKTSPAPGEEADLLRIFGKQWIEPDPSPKPIYDHRGFCFGVLVCSELQSIQNRERFQGKVDCVIVLAWNKDLETFAALVESAALDVHAYIALVNNRAYGDSRVRAPRKDGFARDVCKIRGGLHDYAVIVELDVEELRAFQSRAKNWPTDTDPFKPVPEGYSIAAFRRHTPPK